MKFRIEWYFNDGWETVPLNLAGSQLEATPIIKARDSRVWSQRGGFDQLEPSLVVSSAFLEAWGGNQGVLRSAVKYSCTSSRHYQLNCLQAIYESAWLKHEWSLLLSDVIEANYKARQLFKLEWCNFLDWDCAVHFAILIITNKWF